MLSAAIQYPQVKILVFCKAPIPGEVKTRLAATIGDDSAAMVHRFLARHCLKAFVEYGLASVELWCTPETSHGFFQQCEDEFGVQLKNQGTGDLGERMKRALSDALSDSEYVLIVGTDCLGLDKAYLDNAIKQLMSGVQTVVAPAEDGGYVLLGCRVIQPAIFQNISWGSNQVLSQTLAKLKDRFELLPVLWDVDRFEDLQRLRVNSIAFGLDEEFGQYLELVTRTEVNASLPGVSCAAD